jgi:signal transduction histidine kinase
MTRPRLRSVLLLINVMILILPLAGLWLLRLYESALVRQTESELVAQAAVIAAAFKAERQQLLARGFAEDEGAVPAAPALPFARAAAQGLDLADDPVLPPPPDPSAAKEGAGPLALAAGAALLLVLRDTQAVTLASIRVTDWRGVIVATTGEDGGMTLAGRQEVDAALKGELVSLMRWRERPARPAVTGLSRGANLRVFVAMPVIDGNKVVGAVMLARTPRDLAQAIYGKRYPLLALAFLLLAAVTALALIASRLITRPLGQVVSQAQLVAGGSLGAVVPLSGPAIREAAELSAAVARMAQTLERRADYIRSFAAHVSHEFKTPLAGAKGALELLGDHFSTMSESERGHFLGVVATSVDRLETLVRRLLDLARADMMRPGGAERTVLAPLLERLAQRYAERGLALRLRQGAIAAALAEDALDIVLSSLLDNVLDHAGRGSEVTIETTAAAPGGIAISVSDNGPGVTRDDAERIFEPFFTTARASGGTGLGLSIARAIVAGAGGTIALMPSPRGACFRLVIPSAAG